MAELRPKQIDGGGYGRPPATYNATLAAVGPGTPCGELMRRYWHPVAKASSITDRPQRLRILGEDLVLFRDRAGRPGLLYSRCCHRGTTLYYGKVEERGIRCCYHGWLFDVEGHCLEQPCEPEGGLKRETARQPWYPVEERYGLLFAYMGPLDRKPALPRYDILEDLGPGEMLEQEEHSFYAGGPFPDGPDVPYNWLQNYENVMDPYHVLVLHATFTGTQFRREFEAFPKVEWEHADHGVAYRALRNLDGRSFLRVTQVLLPNVRIVPSVELTPGPGREVAWIVPVDDTHHRTFGVARVTEPGLYTRRSRRANFNGKLWSELTEEEHQLYPGDFEAQMGQGAITLHSEERLRGSDRGIGMLRALLTREVRRVGEGRDPVGTTTDPAGAVVRVRAGNFFDGHRADAAE